MRVILLINSLYTGGAEFSSLKFYSYLKMEEQAEILIVCLKDAKPSYDPFQFGFDEVNFLSGKSFFQKVKSFNLLVTQFKPHIVHSVLFDANLIGRICKLWKGGFIHMESLVSQTYSIYRLKDPNITRFKLEFYRVIDFVTQIYGVDHFHSNGKTVAQHYREKLYINKNRITVIPRGREKNSFLINNDELPIGLKKLKLKGKMFLINVARHEHLKAHTLILDALNELETFKDKCVLLIVGREGKATQSIKDKIVKYNLQDNVILLGHRNDVPFLLASSDIFIFPSRIEGLPGALIEAEAAGLPIICSNIPNNLEVVQENENALVFDVDDQQRLTECLRELVLDENKRKLMGENSLKIYSENFQIDRVHEKMHDLLQQVIKKKMCKNSISL